MSPTRADLLEMIETLHDELQKERLLTRALQEENERLVRSLIEASRHYEKLVDYIRSLRAWLSEREKGGRRSGSDEDGGDAD